MIEYAQPCRYAIALLMPWWELSASVVMASTLGHKTSVGRLILRDLGASFRGTLFGVGLKGSQRETDQVLGSRSPIVKDTQGGWFLRFRVCVLMLYM